MWPLESAPILCSMLCFPSCQKNLFRSANFRCSGLLSALLCYLCVLLTLVCWTPVTTLHKQIYCRYRCKCIKTQKNMVLMWMDFMLTSSTLVPDFRSVWSGWCILKELQNRFRDHFTYLCLLRYVSLMSPTCFLQKLSVGVLGVTN